MDLFLHLLPFCLFLRWSPGRYHCCDKALSAAQWIIASHARTLLELPHLSGELPNIPYEEADSLPPGAASPSLLHPALQSAHLQQLQQLQSHIMRSAELRASPFLSPQNSLLHSAAPLHSQQTGYFPMFGNSGSPFAPPVGKDAKEEPKMTKPESSSNVVSSTMDDDDKTAIKVGNCPPPQFCISHSLFLSSPDKQVTKT